MMKSLIVAAVLALVPSCTFLGAATGYSVAGAHNASNPKDHMSSGQATAAGAVVGLLVDAALLAAVASYELSNTNPQGCGGCYGY